MKKTAFTFIIFIMTTVLFGQEFKFSIGPTASGIFHYKFVAGGPYGTPRLGLNSQFDYLFVTKKKVEFGIGVGYQNSQLEIVDPLDGVNGYSTYIQKVELLTLRLRSVLNFRNDFYISFDPIIDFQINGGHLGQVIDNQSGLGFAMGIGNNINLNKSLALNIEPTLWIHNIVPFKAKDQPVHLSVVGLNFGLIFGHKTE
jgi:hypothetical protein